MNSNPCILVVYAEDKISLPIEHLLILAQRQFRLGVTEIKKENEKVYIFLTYCPEEIILKKKFGDSPIRYIRINSEGKPKIWDNVVKRYMYEPLDDEKEVIFQLARLVRRGRLSQPKVNLDEKEDVNNNL